MSGEYDRLLGLMLDDERRRLDALDTHVSNHRSRLERIGDALADDLEAGAGSAQNSRLVNALSEVTTASLEVAVRRRPEVVVDVVYPVIGPAIRKAISEALRRMADDMDSVVRQAVGMRPLFWRLEAWRSGVPYAEVVLRHSTRYRVEHLFLIHPESGLLLDHLTARGSEPLDADAVAGMFTAIHQFVRDSVGNDGDGIGSATVGGYRLAVSEGPHARLVAFVDGVPSSDFDRRLAALNEEIHSRHGAQALEAATDRQGDETGLLLQEQVDALNVRGERQDAPQPKRRTLAIAGAVLGLLVLAVAIQSWRWSRRESAIEAGLSALPGVVLSGVDTSLWGRLDIRGLWDPATPDPKAWMHRHYPQAKVDWQLSPYFSLAPAAIRAHVARALGLGEDHVALPDADGRVRLSGQVSFADWLRVSRTPMMVPGVSRIDTDALLFPQRAQVDGLVRRIEALPVNFEVGTTAPSAESAQALAQLQSLVTQLQQVGTHAGIRFHLLTRGSTDGRGDATDNRMLRVQRADWLASRLQPVVVAPHSVDVDDSVASLHPRQQAVRSAEVRVEMDAAR